MTIPTVSLKPRMTAYCRRIVSLDKALTFATTHVLLKSLNAPLVARNRKRQLTIPPLIQDVLLSDVPRQERLKGEVLL